MTNAAQERSINILLVEDSPSDARLTMEALRDGHLLNEVHHVSNGEDAVAFLRRDGPHAEAPRPDIILLDLNIPRRSGHEVLGEIKEDEELCHIPVVVLTSSDDQKDIEASYRMRANCYIKKPVDLDGFLDVVKAIDNFFVKVVTLPR